MPTLYIYFFGHPIPDQVRGKTVVIQLKVRNLFKTFNSMIPLYGVTISAP